MSSFDAASDLTLKEGGPPARGTTWKFVADVDALPHDVAAALFRANLPSTFGRDSVKAEQNGKDAWGAVYIGPRHRQISAAAWWSLEWFFARDEAEANVFEYDPIYDKFVRLNFEDIKTRRKP